MTDKNKGKLHPHENHPQTDNPTKKQIGRKDEKDHPHEPPIAREQTDHTKNTARIHGLNEDLVDTNETEPLN
jgi:hypothetical protein